MCGRYRNMQSWSELHAAMRSFLGEPKQPPLNMPARAQVRPTQSAPIVRLSEDGPLVADARWWLVPWFHKGKPLKAWKATTINARTETVATAATFREPFKKRRCLVVADGWYEWTGPKGAKQMHLFGPRGAEPIMFAGLWDSCETSDEGRVESFTIVTQPAGSPLNAIHDRAPVVLFGEEWARWLDVTADVSDLLGPESRDRFDIRTYDPAEDIAG